MLDYCNTLLYGTSAKNLTWLQRIQNSLAQLVTNSSFSSSSTSVLHSLHWLPVKYRITHKIACLTFKATHLQTPHYIHSLISHHKTFVTRQKSHTFIYVHCFRCECFHLLMPDHLEYLPFHRHITAYYVLLTPLLTRSSANAEVPCEHAVSWNRVKCYTNVRRIGFEKACNRWVTFKVIQGHYRCCHLIGHILFPISLPLYVYFFLAQFSRY